MAVRGLEETTSRLDQAKRFGGLVVVAILLAAVVVGALILTGLFAFAPVPVVRVLGFRVPPAWMAFIGAFSFALAFILAYVYYAKLIKSSVSKAKEFWVGLPDLAQAAVLGVGAGILAALSLVLTDRILYGVQATIILATGVGVGLIVVVLTIRLRNRGWTLFEWTRTLFTSALVGGIIAVLAGLAFAGVVPGYVPAAVFLVAWAVCLYLLFRRHHRIEDSVVTRLLTKTGYAQMREVETFTVSVGTGLVLAVVVSVLVGVAGTTPDSMVQRMGLALLFVWPVVTVAIWLGWPSRERTDLVIEDITVRSSTGNREVTVRNNGDSVLNLRGAKITDANDTLYTFNISASLGAGETAKFQIPEIFDLATHDRYTVFTLPYEYVLTKEATEPRVVTRDGRQYVLLWVDQVEEYESGATV